MALNPLARRRLDSLIGADGCRYCVRPKRSGTSLNDLAARESLNLSTQCLNLGLECGDAGSITALTKRRPHG